MWPPVCPSAENPDLVFQKTGYSQSPTYSRLGECDSRQTIQAMPDHPDRMVPPSRGLPSNIFPVAPASSGPVCHQVPQQTATICFTGSRPPCLSSGCTQPVLGGSATICLPTGGHLGQSGGEVAGLPVQQNHSDYSRVATHALVLGPGGHVQPDPIVPAQPVQFVDSAIQ